MKSSGIFHYRSELPATRIEISAGEGQTPVVPLPRIGRRIGLPNLYAKLEGCNPTGSYKDRVAAMSISLALDAGKTAWIATSSGNAGTSFAAYGSRAGIPGLLCVVPSIPREKLIPILACPGAHAIKVEGVGDGGDKVSERLMFTSVNDAAGRHNLFLAVTAHRFNEQGMRGADTIAFELIDAGFGESVVYVPTGGGGLVSAVCRGARSRNSTMRVVAVQPSGCAPIVRYLDAEIPEPIIPQCGSAISGLQLPSPPDGELAARSVIGTGGWGTTVSDEQIAESQSLLASTEGILVEPASAAALAAAHDDRRIGKLAATDPVMMLLTATGLKDLRALEAGSQAPRLISAQRLADTIDSWADRLRLGKSPECAPGDPR